MGVLAGFAFLTVTAIAVVIEPLPHGLRTRAFAIGTVVEDSAGRILGQSRNGDYRLAIPVQLTRVPAPVRRAILAAEDARFYRHRGVDPLAIVRAAWQLVLHRRIISGGSTITQQLARTLVPRSRNFYGKWREMTVSLRIEASLDKDAILEAYLNHVPFGPTTQGIAAASAEYFGKPVEALSLGEAVALAALPRGPARYHPGRQPARLKDRRGQILRRLQSLQWIPVDAGTIAQNEPIRLRDPLAGGIAPHFLRSLTQGRLWAGGQPSGHVARWRTTLDRELQTEVEKLLGDARGQLDAAGAGAAAAVVIDNAHAELLTYVGSPSFFDAARLGQNDGCLALRQPGSALKPFLYAAAIDGLGMGPTTQLADVETHFSTPSGEFTPRNYDGRYRGLVLLRDALGASLNVPAVQVAERLGVERFLGLLRRFGFQSLSAPASHYGLALALGDGEVRLLELALAYSALGRSGRYLPLRMVSSWIDASGKSHAVAFAEGSQVIAEPTAWQLLEMLSDDAARATSFGRHGALDMPVVAATKTGTSSNHRDNWAVAVTHEVTVAIWVGNFDGRPLALGTSGVVGAAPLLRAVLAASMRRRNAEPLFPQDRLQTRRICKISGKAPGPACPDRVETRMVAGHFNDEICPLHQTLRIDLQNGLLAGPGCRDAVERTFEIYPDALLPWAISAGRPVAPRQQSPRCPGGSEPIGERRLTIRSPIAGARYLIDPHLPAAQQQLAMAVNVQGDVEWVEYELDGLRSGRVRPPFAWRWPMLRGRHRLQVTAAGGMKDALQFEVD